MDTSLSSTASTLKSTSSSFHSMMDDPLPYRSQMTARNLVISRSTNYSTGPSNSAASSRRSSYSLVSGVNSAPPGAYSTVTSAGVADVKSSREREKRDMQDLNERFANYIEKVRFLEAQNRRLADELEKLKSRWGRETTQIKAMYQAELDEARKLLDDAVKEKARLEIKCASLEEQIEELRHRYVETTKSILESKETIDRQNQQLSNYESEVNSLRHRVECWENDRDKDKQKIAALQDALNNTRIDLDSETLQHIDAENRRQTLEEEIEFMQQIHEQEMKELAALAYRDSTRENRDYWKNEMAQALREIQTVYDDKLDEMRSEMETFYNLKIQEFRTGVTRQNVETLHAKEESSYLRTQVTDLRDKLNDLDARNAALQLELDALRREKEDRERQLEAENTALKGDVIQLRAEMDAIMRELQMIMDTKLGLELEIAAYRKLLEGEENRIGLRQVVDSLYGSMTSTESVKPMKGEMSAKTTYQRTAKGPVSILECSADGRFICIENTGRKDEFLGGWQLKRTVDHVERSPYLLPQDVVLAPGAKIKLWAKDCRPLNAANTDIEVDEPSWGSGGNIITRLANPSGEDRASHVQKTVYM